MHLPLLEQYRLCYDWLDPLPPLKFPEFNILLSSHPIIRKDFAPPGAGGNKGSCGHRPARCCCQDCAPSRASSQMRRPGNSALCPSSQHWKWTFQGYMPEIEKAIKNPINRQKRGMAPFQGRCLVFQVSLANWEKWNTPHHYWPSL